MTVIRQLLSSGAKVNQPREVMSFFSTRPCYTCFLSPPPIYCMSCFSLTPLQDGTAPLWMAAQMGHSEAVKVLLLRGADRDADRQVHSSFRTKKIKNVNEGIFIVCLVPSQQ